MRKTRKPRAVKWDMISWVAGIDGTWKLDRCHTRAEASQLQHTLTDDGFTTTRPIMVVVQ